VGAHEYQLRARLRPLASNPRVRDCGRRAISAEPAVMVQQFPGYWKAWYVGVLKCGRQHSCSVCAARKAAERLDELDRMMQGDANGRWQMVTLTLQHHAGEALKDTLTRLHQAFRRVRRTRIVRDIFSARVSASVRATEVTYGRNGWHPHIHLLLRTSEWGETDQKSLEAEWLRYAPGLEAVAVVWSTPIESWHKQRALYLQKLGAEVAGIGKIGKRGSIGPWQVAERAVDDAASREMWRKYLERVSGKKYPPVKLEPLRARALWREYQETMRGRRTLEFDERAKALLERAPEKEQPLQEWRCDIFAEEFAEYVRLESVVPSILWELLETATHSGLDPPTQVRISIDDALQAA